MYIYHGWVPDPSDLYTSLVKDSKGNAEDAVGRVDTAFLNEHQNAVAQGDSLVVYCMYDTRYTEKPKKLYFYDNACRFTRAEYIGDMNNVLYSLVNLEDQFDMTAKEERIQYKKRPDHYNFPSVPSASKKRLHGNHPDAHGGGMATRNEHRRTMLQPYHHPYSRYAP